MSVARDKRLGALEERLRAAGAKVAEHKGASRDLGRFTKYADNPVGFIRDVLKGEPWSRQEEIANLCRDSRYVAVRSCNGAGKDWTAARLALWWTYAYGGYVVVIAPTARQVEEVFFGELGRAFRRARTLPGTLYTTALRVPGAGQAGVLGFTSNDVSRLTGLHAARLMVILSEAQGLEPFAWEGALALATGADSKVIATGNPLSTSGRFFEVSRNAAWASVRIDGFEHPNVVEGREVIPGAITRQFVDLMRAEYGEDSGTFRARVRGEWPDGDDDALVRRTWLELAAQRHADRSLEEEAAGRPLVFSLDPARFGSDQSALVVMQGPVVREVVTWGKLDTMQSCGRVLEAVDRWGVVRREACVIVDEVGLGGGILDRLREEGVAASGFNGGRTALDPARFQNQRAESYWHLRKRLEEGRLAVPRDERLWDELTALRWRPNSAGKIQIEAKDDLRGRIGRSPDRADALAMALAVPQTDPLDAAAVKGFGAMNDSLMRRNDVLAYASRWSPGGAPEFGEDGDGSVNIAPNWPA